MKKIIKFSLYSIIGLILFVTLLFLSVTTQPVLKNVVIPIIERSMDARINTDYIYLSLIKGEVKLKSFDLISNNKSYSIKIGDFDCKIKLTDLWNNKITIPHLNIENTQLNIIDDIRYDTAENKVENKDVEKEKKEQKIETDTDTPPLLLNLSNVRITNFNLNYKIIREDKDSSSILNLKNCQIIAPKIITDEKSNVEYKVNIKITGLNKDDIDGGLNGAAEFTLNKDFYPAYVASNTVMNFGKTKTPISVKLNRGGDELGAAPFSLYGNIRDLQLLPVFKTFVEGSYSNSRGTLKDITLNISGTDIENIDISKNIKGDLSVDMENLEVPTQLLDYKIAKLVFLPIYIIAHLNDFLTKNDVLPSQLSGIFDISNQILAGAKEFTFRTGEVDLNIDNGLINIVQFILKGGKGCPVRKMEFAGYVDLNNQMDIETETNMTGIIIPLTIRGTVEEPKPLVKRMLPALVGKTAENLVKAGAEVGVDLGKKLGESAGNFIKKLPNIIQEDSKE